MNLKQFTFFPGMEKMVDSTFDTRQSPSKQVSEIFASTINLIELSVQLFIVCTIRTYEDEIIKEDSQYKKKTQPVVSILRDRFVAPSLGSQLELCKYCFHLVDAKAPKELIFMKAKLEETITLGPLGLYLDELEKLYDTLDDESSQKPKVQNREKSKKKFLAVLNDFIPYRNDSSHLVNIQKLIEDNGEKARLNVANWRDGLILLITSLEPFLAQKFSTKKIGNIYTENSSKMISVNFWRYHNDKINISQDKILLENWYEDQWDEQSSVILTFQDGKEKSVEIFPFIIIKDERLFIYKKTKTSGYDYFSISDSKTTSVKSKKKFNRTLFKTSTVGNSQALFWSEVLPDTNPKNTIKANIPTQGKSLFIGRKKKIAKIRQEIIEIPNQNGIIYGPGGVGKTALLIELTQLLFNNVDNDEVLYSNIIWISAKSNFYYWEQNATISKPQQFETLENILQIMLRFFDYEDVHEYSNEELKDLVFGLLEENKILLVLDNFETIAKNEIGKIISFFETDVKRRLRYKPTYFKVIITSRELIPSGYYQIKLEGLEMKESKELMENIYENYKDSQPKLSEEQCILIHDAAQGIPIVIKHCLGQIYEFNYPLGDILTGLSNEQNEVIKFSYSEILSQLKKDKIFLQILLLLEIKNEPTSIRQIALALETDLKAINKCIPSLLNFQCIDKINTGIEEKYKISNQIGLLAKKLIGENPQLTTSLRNKITKNLTWEKRIDSEVEEWEIIDIFNSRIESMDFEYAEHFLDGEIKKRPSSQLLNLNKAIFLRDRKKEINQSISILEKLYSDIKSSGKSDPNILLALATTYTRKEFPDFEKADICCRELFEIADQNSTKMFLGEFYISWSTYLKGKKELDPFEEMERRTKVKDLAKKGIRILANLSPEFGNHKYHNLMAQAYFNQWDTENAKKFILRAIDLSQNDKMSLRKYESFLSMVEKYL
jgi:hypothetical protein